MVLVGVGRGLFVGGCRVVGMDLVQKKLVLWVINYGFYVFMVVDGD